MGDKTKRPNPVLVGVSALVAVTLAALCGRTLDGRYRTALESGARPVHVGNAEDNSEFTPGSSSDINPAADAPAHTSELESQENSASAGARTDSGAADIGTWASGRAGLRLPTEGEGQEAVKAASVREQVARLSHLRGAAPLSTERWLIHDPVVYDGVDLSPLLARAATLRRSTNPNYRIKNIRLSADLSRANTFVDLSLGTSTVDSKQRRAGEFLFRFTNRKVDAFFRTVSGQLLPQGSIEVPATPECNIVRLIVDGDASAAPDAASARSGSTGAGSAGNAPAGGPGGVSNRADTLSVRCGPDGAPAATLLTVPRGGAGGGINPASPLTVTTNLVASEIGEFAVVGEVNKSGASPVVVEDRA